MTGTKINNFMLRGFFSPLLLLILIFVVTGCGGVKAPQRAATVFWPDAELPRVQFLMSINGNYDVLDRATGLDLISFKDTQKTEMDPIIKPTGIAVHKNKIYVCDGGRSTVFSLDLVNKTYEKLKGNFGRGALGKPLNLAFDDDDNLYVADAVRGDVAVYNAEGQFKMSIGREQALNPTNVAVDGDFVYVLDTRKHALRVFNRHTGEFSHAIGEGDDMGEHRLYYPFGLSIDKEGFIYVANIGSAKLTKFDRDGHVLHSFGKMGSNYGHFSRPRGIAIDDNFFTYVVDAAHENVQMFNEQGRLLMFFGDGKTQSPAGIAITSESLEFFQALAAPGFELDQVLLVTSHFGDNRVGVYGMGKQRGIDYEAEYSEIKRKLQELAEKEKAEKEKAEAAAQ